MNEIKEIIEELKEYRAELEAWLVANFKHQDVNN